MSPYPIQGTELCSVAGELSTCYMKISTPLCWEPPAGRRNAMQLCYSRVFALLLHRTPTDFQNLPPAVPPPSSHRFQSLNNSGKQVWATRSTGAKTCDYRRYTSSNLREYRIQEPSILSNIILDGSYALRFMKISFCY
jgi:hypothetical protein